MAHDGIAKVQHYVPHFLLKRWGVGKKDHVSVFEKASRRTWNTKARNIARESGYYDFDGTGGKGTFEPALEQLETAAVSPIRALVESRNLRSLTAADRSRLAAFLSIQFVRTPGFRAMASSMFASLENQIRASLAPGQDPDNGVVELMGSLDHEAQAKLLSLDMLLSAPSEFAHLFLNKTWLLLSPPAKREFLIGDNPIGLRNQTPRIAFMGNLGLAVRGIEIYFPLSPVLCLAMYCRSHEERMRQLLDEAQWRARMAGAPPEHLLAPFTRSFLQAVDSGTPMACSPDYLDNINSVQIGSAERHVFAANESFGLAHRMLDANPRYRHGPRPSTG